MSITRLIVLTAATAAFASAALAAEKPVVHRRHALYRHAQPQSQPTSYSGTSWVLPQGWPNPQG